MLARPTLLRLTTSLGARHVRLNSHKISPLYNHTVKRFKHYEGIEKTDQKQQEEEDKELFQHHKPATWVDKSALRIVKLLRIPTDLFFSTRYGHRAVVLETVAAVPGMVGGMLAHMQSLRRMRVDHGLIQTLLDEATNERMHLMAFIHIAKPTFLERMLVLSAQTGFFLIYATVYILYPKMAHRIVGYLEEEAIVSYTSYLKEIDEGRAENVRAPDMAIEYWKLPPNATLREMIVAIRKDEQNHRDVNHYISDTLVKGERPHFDDSKNKDQDNQNKPDGEENKHKDMKDKGKEGDSKQKDGTDKPEERLKDKK